VNPHAPPQPAADLLCDLAVALGEAGTPAHRLEEALQRCAAHLGVPASFFAMPTAVFASFGAEGSAGACDDPVRTRLVRIHSAETNLARLTDLDRLLVDIVEGRAGVAAARLRLDRIRATPPAYPRAVTLLCFGAVAVCAARFFGAGRHELAAAPLAGLIVGTLLIHGGRRTGRIAEFLAGLLAAAAAAAAAQWLPPCDARTVMLAGLIVLIPGLTLTLAVTELATRNLMSGTARLVGALTTFVLIGFGVAIGQRLMEKTLGAVEQVRSDALPEWTLPLSLALVPFPLAVLFRARMRDVPAIMGSAFTAYYGARLGAWALGPELGVCIAAMLVGLAANLFARITGRPAAVPLLPGILLLVPGSVGFESVRSFVAHDTVAGVATAFSMLLVAIAIVAGLLVANAWAPSRRML